MLPGSTPVLLVHHSLVSPSLGRSNGKSLATRNPHTCAYSLVSCTHLNGLKGMCVFFSSPLPKEVWQTVLKFSTLSLHPLLWASLVRGIYSLYYLLPPSASPSWGGRGAAWRVYQQVPLSSHLWVWCPSWLLCPGKVYLGYGEGGAVGREGL